MKGQRKVAGLWCHEVLEKLYDHVDGALADDARATVEAHLAGCDVCATFGGKAGALAKAIRARLTEPDPLPESLRARLQQVPDLEDT